jgi:2,4-dienoyl-CoA reductase-like NADH-dependent reductase (Old Yellow Enzyme family)
LTRTGLFSPLVLRSGGVLRNRIAKAAMEEGMAGRCQLPDERLTCLYRRWGAGGAGLVITGNVMVHAQALTGPGGVVLDDRAPLDPFARWAEAGKAGGAAMWMQISHPGRQVQARMPGVAWGPSAVATALASSSPLPLMLTGGITRRETAEAVLASGIAVAGMATALAVTPDLPDRWRAGHEATERLAPVTWSDKALASAAGMSLARFQMRRMTRGQDPTGKVRPSHALACDQRAQRRALGRYRAWLRARA